METILIPKICDCILSISQFWCVYNKYTHWDYVRWVQNLCIQLYNILHEYVSLYLSQKNVSIYLKKLNVFNKEKAKMNTPFESFCQQNWFGLTFHYTILDDLFSTFSCLSPLKSTSILLVLEIAHDPVEFDPHCVFGTSLLCNFHFLVFPWVFSPSTTFKTQ